MPAAAPAIAAAAAAFKASAVGTFLATTFGKLLVTVAVSALQSVLFAPPKVPKPGLRTEQTLTGGVNPQSFIVGLYATSGTAAAPAVTHSKAGKKNNTFLNYILDVGDLPGHQISRLIINGEYAEIGIFADPEFGLPLLGKFEDLAWIRWHDGTQTEADALMLAKYPAEPVTGPFGIVQAQAAEFPWSADMVGTGVPYAVLTFKFERKVFSGFPEVRFEVVGIPVYDPRKDSSVGGSGTHRWDDPATHEPSRNPMVLAYNVARGIRLPVPGFVWGGRYRAEQLPLPQWFAAMNACDLPVERADATFEPQFEAGFEVRLDDEPRDVLGELGKAAAAEYAESGGRLLVRVGPPALPVWFFTDDDVIVTEEDRHTPFPDPGDVWNGLAATYREPESVWEPRAAPVLLRPDLEALDEGQRRVAELDLPAVFSPTQVQRLQRLWVNDNRRFIRHVIAAPPEAMLLDPLDAVAWTSQRFGYQAKVFEVAAVERSLREGTVTLMLQEKDAADFAHDPADEQPTEPPVAAGVGLPPRTLDDLAVSAIAIEDATGAPRRPGIEVTWDGDEPDADGIGWELRLAGAAFPALTGSTQDVASGRLVIAEGLLPATAYELRGTLLVPHREAEWTAWAPVTTLDLLIVSQDVASGGIETGNMADDAITTLRSASSSTKPLTLNFTLDQTSRILIIGSIDATARDITTTISANGTPIITATDDFTGSAAGGSEGSQTVFFPTRQFRTYSRSLLMAAGPRSVSITATPNNNNIQLLDLTLIELKR
ncbi:MAG: hypothetical protein CVT80_00260 [Alphaproteobacteria bacterium HGW-Alphaproteobacteria-2]|nr:MAG: hypothetical protein CVT80_00260 [Alphaproteobacteria bacterium HGW-Alphaproteobacteria-2]